jgi:hypothetical protein
MPNYRKVEKYEGDIDFWKEQDKSVYEKILKNYWDINVDGSYDWWDYVFEGFIEDMTDKYGWAPEYEDIYFSGFSHQGDGACFEGGMGTEDAHNILVEILEKKSVFCDILDPTKGAVYCGVGLKHTARYSHEDSVTTILDIEIEEYENLFNILLESDDGLWYLQYRDGTISRDTEYDEDVHDDILDSIIDGVGEDIYELIDDWRKDRCRELYKSLNLEYDGFTEESAVIDTLQANEYIFDENGHMV